MFQRLCFSACLPRVICKNCRRKRQLPFTPWILVLLYSGVLYNHHLRVISQMPLLNRKAKIIFKARYLSSVFEAWLQMSCKAAVISGYSFQGAAPSPLKPGSSPQRQGVPEIILVSFSYTHSSTGYIIWIAWVKMALRTGHNSLYRFCRGLTAWVNALTCLGQCSEACWSGSPCTMGKQQSFGLGEGLGSQLSLQAV